MDFDRRPFTVIWETTRACDLACVHCRAEANPQRSKDELTFEEVQQLAASQAWAGSVSSFYGRLPTMPSPDRYLGMPGQDRPEGEESWSSEGAMRSMIRLELGAADFEPGFTFLRDLRRQP